MWLSLLAMINWRMVVGDPTLLGWVIAVGYVGAAVLCVMCWIGVERGRRGEEGNWFWLILGVGLFLLGINKQLDFIAMDVKAPMELLKYRKIVGKNFNSSLMAKVIESVDILKSAGIEFEFRTTLDSLLVMADIENIIDSISGNYYLQLVHNCDKSLQIGQNYFTVSMLENIASKPFKNTTICIRE